VSGSLFSDSGEALMSAAVNHLGIVYLPLWMVNQTIETGELVIVLPEWKLEDNLTSIQAVIGHRPHIPSKVEAFVKFLKSELANLNWN
jgi:DNA-binding transcriptional LysR family regulator